jgi:type IV pilus biogenesis protein CpaD/CtpE
MNKYFNTSSLSLFALMIGIAFCFEGCSDPAQQKAMRSLDSKWQAKADRKSYYETFSFGKGALQLNATHKHKIKELAKLLKPNTPIYARILVSQGYFEAQKSSAHKRAKSISAFLLTLGVLKKNIEVIERHGIRSESLTPADVTIVLDQYHLVLPECPGWESMHTNSVTHGEEGFGCSNAYNLGLMVSNPKDLYEADRLDKGDGPYQAQSIERYRQDKKKEVKIEKPAQSDN